MVLRCFQVVSVYGGILVRLGHKEAAQLIGKTHFKTDSEDYLAAAMGMLK